MNSAVRALGALAIVAGTLIPGAAFADDDRSLDSARVQVAASPSGNVVIHGAKVASVSGSTLTVTTAWGSTTLTWTVVVDSTTSFIGKSGGVLSLSDIAVGDTVSFRGSWNAGSALSVKASAIKDLTRGNLDTSARGTVASVNASGFSLVFAKSNGAATSTLVASSTTPVTLNGIASAFSALLAGDVVKASGSWNSDRTVFTATAVTAFRNPGFEDKSFNAFLKKWFSKKESKESKDSRGSRHGSDDD